MVKKIALKIPKVLVNLGRAIEVKGEHIHFYFSKKDHVDLFSTPDGKTLFCIKIRNKKFTKNQFEEIWKKYETKANEGVKLYEKWNDFESKSGTMIDSPRGFLFQIDRCKSIVYESDKWGNKKNKYIHEFKKPPLMWVNKKTAPSVLKLSGGAIRTTARGITG